MQVLIEYILTLNRHLKADEGNVYRETFNYTTIRIAVFALTVLITSMNQI